MKLLGPSPTFHTLMHNKEGNRVARVEIGKRKADVANRRSWK